MSHEEATVSTSQSAMDRLKKYLRQQSFLEQACDACMRWSNRRILEIRKSEFPGVAKRWIGAI
ncbi:MAG: hypothetical protein USCGTAYLOR_02031 [Chromatiales bacterium USCg_Taylor]|nr:MAG: hypothetical protein USCGTAYLOR_02031 [Chromatiales bacterium USCg_Taylor]